MKERFSSGQNNPELARQFAATLQRLHGSDAVYQVVTQRFACPLITLDQEQHDRVANMLQTYYPAELLPSI
jgi:hypothetical protein